MTGGTGTLAAAPGSPRDRVWHVGRMTGRFDEGATDGCDAMNDGWIRLIEVSRLNPPPRGTFVEAGGRELAVFHVDELPGVAVIDNVCPHARGNLSGGTLSGAIVACPWHGWEFDVRTGACVDNPEICVRKHACEIRDGVVYVRDFA